MYVLNVFIALCSYLYKISSYLSDDDDEPEFSSADQLDEGEIFF